MRKSVLRIWLVLALAVAPLGLLKAQETAAEKTPTQGLGLLKKFKGTWVTIGNSGSENEETVRGSMTCRVLGDYWVVNEYEAKLGDVQFNAIQSIGVGKDGSLSGSWIDSMTDFRWSYQGRVDRERQEILLEATGPDWQNPEKTRRYRDSYRFKSDNEVISKSQMMNDAGEWETFMTSKMLKVEKQASKPAVTPFLMFQGKANEALALYRAVFQDFEVIQMEKYKEGEQGPAGTIKLATIAIAGQQVKIIDSPISHGFDFTPSFSFFVECSSESELRKKFGELSQGGEVMMPIGNYGFSEKFGWTADKYGVSWQLNLAEPKK